MWRSVLVVLTLGLTACGAEVASTAATVGAVKAKEAEAARQQMEQVRQRLESATELERQRARAIDQ